MSGQLSTNAFSDWAKALYYGYAGGMRLKTAWIIGASSGPLAILIAIAGSAVPQLVESWYSRAFYPFFGATIGWVFGLIPIPVFQMALAAAVLGMLYSFGRGITRLIRPSQRFPRKAWLTRWGAGTLKLLLVTSICLAIFEFSWGFNYQRLPWATSHGWQTNGGTRHELLNLALRLAHDLQSDSVALTTTADGTSRALQGQWGDPATLARVNFAWDRHAISDPILQSHSSGAKALLLPALASQVNIGGIFIAFTQEALVNTDPNNYSIPFAAAHEIAHQRGWAREDEANFMAFLVLQDSPDADLRYSARASALSLVLASGWGEFSETERSGLRAALPAVLVADRHKESAYWRQFRGFWSQVGNAVNDSYLKAQGQGDGIQSYGRMVDLLLAWNQTQKGN